ncbi:MAG: hypothetical protein U5K84_10205 [Alkalibacterium sp.]|nr:hypothetical protein [Alkalibacterium sp.]
MHDIIFSGTDARKAINIAEVTLILDNGDGFLPIDFEEVSIGRRINRNGDSDYFINKESCRLKDIVDLFMDSGLGKESFSIISQGQVEAVFNSKAEDRRAIFEEAAGVFKYKLQKEKAERKLFETQDNLDRVQDILYELNGQLEPLKEQKDIAQSYVRQKEELTDLDISLSVLKIDQYSSEQKESKAEIAEINENLRRVQAKIDRESTDLKAKRQKLHEMEDRREQLQAQTISSVQQIERTEAQLRLVEEKERHQDAFLNEKQASLKKEEDRLNGLTAEYDTLQQTYEAQSAEVAELKGKVKQTSERLARLMGNKEEAIEQLRGDYIDAMQSKTSLKNEETYLERQLQQATVAHEKHKKNQSEVEKKLNEAKAAFKDKSESLEAIRTAIDALLQGYTS